MKNSRNIYLTGLFESFNIFKNKFTMYFKYWVYLVFSTLLKLSFIFYPYGKSIEYKANSILIDINDLKVNTLLDDLDNKGKVRKLFISNIIKITILIASLVVIGVIGLGFMSLAVYFDNMMKNEYFVLVPIVGIPLIIIVLLYITYIFTIFNMIDYLVITEDILLKDAFNESLNLVTVKQVFRTLFIYVINILIVAIVSFILYLIFEYLYGSVQNYQILNAILIILLFFLFLFITTIILSIGLTKQYLLIDIKANPTIKTSVISKKIVTKEEEINITSLFENDSEEI